MSDRTLDELRQTCSAPSDAYSAGVWCEAANDAVLLALAATEALRDCEPVVQHGLWGGDAAEALRYVQKRIAKAFASAGAQRGRGGATVSADRTCQCATCVAHVFNPSRLVMARKRRGVSRHTLATALGLPSVAALARIETGRKAPDNNLVEVAAAVLSFPAGFFYADDLHEISLASIS